MTQIDRFMAAMDGEWEVERYSVEANGRLRIHYVSLSDPDITWSHTPFGELVQMPKIGWRGRIGFVVNREHVDA